MQYWNDAMNELIKLCKKENHVQLLKLKSVQNKIKEMKERLAPFGIDCSCRTDMDYFNLQILDLGVLNKQKIENAYESLAKEMFEIWEDLDYKKRNEFSMQALKELKEDLVSFNYHEKRICIPFFDELMNVLYDKETAILQLPQFFKMYKDFKERMIDPFIYFDKPYQSGFVDVQYIGSNDLGFGFFVVENNSIYVIDKNKKTVVLPLSLSKQVKQLDTNRAMKWVEAVLNQDQKAMVQWCINSGQIEEKIKKKCIALLDKLNKSMV